MQKLLRRKRIIRTVQLVTLDAFSILLTFVLAILLLRLSGVSVDMGMAYMLLPFIIVSKIAFYILFGLYRMLVDHVGFEDIMRIAMVVIVTNTFYFFFFMFTPVVFLEPFIFVFIAPLEIGLISFPRIMKRVVYFFRHNMSWGKENGINTLIVGASDGGELVLKELYRNRALNNNPVAFVDDNPEKIGSHLLGIKVVGPVDEIAQFIDYFDVREVIIAIANLSHKRLQSIIEMVAEKDVKVKRLPLMSEIEEGVRPKVLDVKVEDLLNRDEVELDVSAAKDFISGKTVLITGGGGSIGSELARQIASYKPKQLIIFDIYENNAYEIQTELTRNYKKQKKPLNLVTLIGSVYNEQRLREVFEEHRPELLFHAAAYKHVPLMEDSPKEAVRTNVTGTYYTAKLAKEYGVKNFVLVSSDKAVRPTNIMGATKRYAELIIQAFNDEKNGTKYASVRFGNVLGSNGSVIPLFKKQIEEGGPVTVTDPAITRYFMTIPEAVSLILQCGIFSRGGEIFVLDMGKPVKIVDLAEKMIKLAGLKPGRDIDIEFTGLRPGEKLYEELLVENQKDMQMTANEKIYVETRGENGDRIDIDRLIAGFDALPVIDIKKTIAEHIKSYTLQSH